VTARAVVLALLAACSPETVSRPPPPPVNWASLRPAPPPDAAPTSATKQERAIAELYMKATSDGDAAELGRVLADEVHFTFAGLETTAVYGRAEVIRAHDQLFGGYQPKVFTASRVLLTDRSQAIEWTMTGRDKASGKPVGIRGLTLLQTKDDGTISEIHLYFDQGVLQAQITGVPEALATLPLATAPSAPITEVEQGKTPDEQANASPVSRWLDALENAEPAYLAAMTDDVEVTTAQRATPMKGKKDLAAYYAAMHRAIEGLDTQLENVSAIGPYVVAEYHIVGTQRGSYLYVPVKNPVIKVSLVDVIEMRGGKIARVWRYDNPLQILQQ